MRRLLLAAFIALIACFAPSALAADLTWYPTGSHPEGGAGTWDTTSPFWSADGMTFQAWSNTSNDNAVFGGAAGGVVTLGTAIRSITVGNITFSAAGYSIVGTGANVLTMGTAGTITTNNDATINAVLAGTNGFTKAGADTLALGGVSTYSGTTTVANGTLAINTGASIAGPAVVNAGGTMNVFGTARSTLGVSGIANVTGTVSGLTTVQAGGTLNGPGSFAGINNSGTLAPKGAMLSSTDVALNAGGVFRINVVSSGSSDSLTITGAATVAGTLVVSPSYSMSIGDTWTILTASNGITGTYASSQINPANNQVFATTIVGGNSLQLTYDGLAKAGDANKDGVIDGKDLALVGLNWDPSGVNGPHTWVQGDFNNDGVIDGKDLAFIGLNWAPAGYTLSSDVAAPTVPEPVTMALLAIGGLGLLARRNRR